MSIFVCTGTIMLLQSSRTHGPPAEGAGVRRFFGKAESKFPVRLHKITGREEGLIPAPRSGVVQTFQQALE